MDTQGTAAVFIFFLAFIKAKEPLNSNGKELVRQFLTKKKKITKAESIVFLRSVPPKENLHSFENQGVIKQLVFSCKP